MLECEMEVTDPFDRMKCISRQRVHESVFEDSFDFLRWRSDMRSDTDILSGFAESPCVFVADPR